MPLTTLMICNEVIGNEVFVYPVVYDSFEKKINMLGKRLVSL